MQEVVIAAAAAAHCLPCPELNKSTSKDYKCDSSAVIDVP